ncbi:hypothetical protein [Marinobacter persicus]|uniref:Uncharacterized protein n=1 Tax=Marinobacter persicus TaxID=930118 RepID=A0A2S6G2Z3_9GAMM|nr:hypothetical protein [Marinobacter persicus]PPK50029.1 hypothetical protein BY455_13727 [Marinobacter persicus]PPK52075.1 hypothetical protein B0H24_103727 [Marinobacter persicus]PPK56606.1 hypothetical protein BY454_13727 [Marinobacter persicus]
MDEKKLLSPAQIAGGAFWGGPLATVYYLRRNYLALGRDDYAQKTLVYGVLFVIALLVLLPFIPESFPNLVIPLAYCFAARQIASSTQMGKVQIEEAEGYTFESNWKIFGVGILTLLAFFAMALSVIMMFEEAGFLKLT